MAAKKKGAKKGSHLKAVPKLETDAPKLSAEERTLPLPGVVMEAAIASQEYAVEDVATLKKHPKNYRRGNVQAISESISQNKFYGAVYRQKSTGFIIAGNHRFEAAIARGLKQLPVITIDVDDATAERILLADNRTSDLASNDDRALMALLDDVAKRDATLAGTGFMDADLVKMHAKAAPPEKFPEFDEQVKVHYECPNCHFKWS